MPSISQKLTSPIISKKRRRDDDDYSTEVHLKLSRQSERPKRVFNICPPLRVEGAKINLSPCHICRRKPTELSQLDGYANCQSCGGRMCYVCMRQCLGGTQGPEGDYNLLASFEGGDERCGRYSGALEKSQQTHKTFICSRCCVEEGEDGAVSCLGCFGAKKVG